LIKQRISVIIPALNEEQSIGLVIRAIPAGLGCEVIVVDNGSKDATASVARFSGAEVVSEPRRGYGKACLRGLERIDKADVVVFLDADYSDYPEEMRALVEPIIEEKADLVIGSRALGESEAGALAAHQVFGNKLSCFLIGLLWGKKFSDLGPFRAIRAGALKQLGMSDKNFGWNVEMQIKALRKGLRIKEVPVRYRKRIGQSKISGSLSGSLKAGFKIIYSIFKYSFLKESACV